MMHANLTPIHALDFVQSHCNDMAGLEPMQRNKTGKSPEQYLRKTAEHIRALIKQSCAQADVVGAFYERSDRALAKVALGVIDLFVIWPSGGEEAIDRTAYQSYEWFTLIKHLQLELQPSRPHVQLLTKADLAYMNWIAWQGLAAIPHGCLKILTWHPVSQGARVASESYQGYSYHKRSESYQTHFLLCGRALVSSTSTSPNMNSYPEATFIAITWDDAGRRRVGSTAVDTLMGQLTLEPEENSPSIVDLGRLVVL